MGNDDDTPTLVSAVTYVGVPLARLGTVAQDTIGEFATATVWFLGGSVPTDDPASVVVTRDNSANEAYAVAVTFTAGGDTEEVGTRVLLEEDGTLAEQAIDSGAVTALRLVCGRSGLADLPSAGTNSTHLHDMDVGSRVMMMGRETTPGSGSRSVGYSSGATDDRAFIHFAIAEVAGAAAGGSTMSLMGVGR
jgi:hypothetical protein